MPYIGHVVRVMEAGITIDEKIVGVLYDIVEDADWTFEQLEEEGFPKQTVDAIGCLTKTPEDEPYDDFIVRIDVENNLFANHSWYFRNALVRANYMNVQKGIKRSPEYLERFFRNLLMGETNELKNRSMLIGSDPVAQVKTATPLEKIDAKCKICTLDCTLEETAVLQYIKENPRATQKEIAARIGKSERTVKSITVSLTLKGIIERKSGKRNGFWEIKT